MAPLDILKCSGPSFPVGFSTSKTWRLTVSFIAFPPKCRFLMQMTAQKTLNCTDCALRTLVVAHSFHNENLVANLAGTRTVLRRPRNLPNSEPPEPTGGKKC